MPLSRIVSIIADLEQLREGRKPAGFRIRTQHHLLRDQRAFDAGRFARAVLKSTLTNGCAGTGCIQTQETYDYNNRLQPVRIQLGTASNASANYCLVYNYYAGVANPTTCTATPSQGTTGNNGNVMGYLYQDAVNTSLQHSLTYGYDAVNRLSSATAKDLSSNTLWTQSYIFTTDTSNGQYGNMTCMVGGSGYCPQVTFNSSTNRVSQIGSLNASFDPAGDMTGDGTHTYQWDAEGRMTSVDSGSTATQKYNALGQRVERFLPNGSWTFDYLFSAGGKELGLCSAGTAAWFDQYVPMGGRLLLDYGSLGAPGSPSRFLHANNLESTTVVTDQTGTELEDHLAYPWGQSWTTAGLGYDIHFAGMHQMESPESLYPTDFRKYAPALGRWMSPDPLGGDVTNPQSLNRYPYVTNIPTTFTDPLGLDPCESFNPLGCPPDSGCEEWDNGSCSGNPTCDSLSILVPFGCVNPAPCVVLGFPCGGYGGGYGGVGGAPPPGAPPAGQPPLRGGVGFISPNDAAVWEQVEQQFPWIAQTVWACAFLPVCQEGLATAVAGAAAGVLVYEGVQAGIQIYQMGRVQSNEWTDLARQLSPKDPCGWLAAQKLLPQNQNPATQKKIVQAEKFLGCRNVSKRIQ